MFLTNSPNRALRLIGYQITDRVQGLDAGADEFICNCIHSIRLGRSLVKFLCHFSQSQLLLLN
ncbi:hypothetical protein [Coleofasciculus sp.]|uniref:hypothetical protein n=1 Tax=Coleofasciculus sp. TaxID=3100458 RepID=UPI003A3F2E4C